MRVPRVRFTVEWLSGPGVRLSAYILEPREDSKFTPRFVFAAASASRFGKRSTARCCLDLQRALAKSFDPKRQILLVVRPNE